MQRSDQRERTADSGSVAEDLLSDDSGGREESGGGGRLGGLFSPRAFLLALALSVAAGVAGGFVPLLGPVTSVLGLFAAAFAVGLLSSRRRYLEVGLAGALASILVLVVSMLGTFLPFAVGLLAERGTIVVGAGVGTGLLVSLVGHYFGRDLRAGLTQSV